MLELLQRCWSLSTGPAVLFGGNAEYLNFVWEMIDGTRSAGPGKLTELMQLHLWLFRFERLCSVLPYLLGENASG